MQQVKRKRPDCLSAHPSVLPHAHISIYILTYTHNQHPYFKGFGSKSWLLILIGSHKTQVGGKTDFKKPQSELCAKGHEGAPGGQKEGLSRPRSG